MQVGSTVYRYMEDGIYSTDQANAILLEDLEELPSKLKSAKALDSRITYYSASYFQEEQSNIETRSSNPTLANTPLLLENGVSIPSSHIRDLNYKDKGDANWVSRTWSGIWGKKIVAANKFSSRRKMITTFYDQDYYIYKNIGTQVKMQKKRVGIWWNTRAEEMRLGWDAIELEESFSTPPFNHVQRPINVKPHPSFSAHELSTPTWLSKDFPFAKKFTLFTVPFVQYDVTNKNINQLYMQAIKSVDKAIKAKMKAENQKNTPKNIGIASLTPENKMRYIIGKNEDSRTKKNSMEKKFYSKWFDGTYMLGYSTDPTNPSMSFKNTSGSLKGSKTELKRGIVYGAVKYNGEWRAARIMKTE